MEVVDTTQINSFAPIAAQTDFVVSPSEEALFITSSQLQDIITKAVQEAIQPLQDEMAALREEHDKDRKELAVLRRSVTSLETLQEEDTNRLCLDICQDRQRLAKLEKSGPATSAQITPPPGEKTISRIAKVKDFLKNRGGGATFKECERLLGIKPNQMTRLVSMLDKRSFEVFTRAGDGRERVIRLKCFT
jgi:hypothetical protein